MKLEIEITEDEIKSAIERKVRTAIADQTNQWGSDKYIRDRVKERWHAVVEQMINDVISNHGTLREKIQAELEKKIRSQLSAAIKRAEK